MPLNALDMTSEPSSTATTISTPKKSSKRVCKTATSIRHQSGQMSRPSALPNLEDTLTASLLASHASHSVSPVSELVSKINAIYSQTSSDSQTKVASLCSCSKTFLGCYPQRKKQPLPSQTLCGSWPKRGSMLLGSVFAPTKPKSKPRTKEKECSSSPGEQPAQSKNWTTPQKHDSSEATRISSARTSVPAEVRKWGTPRASDSKGVGPKGSSSQVHSNDHGYLIGQVEEHEDSGKNLHRLNPAWAETLMGWPVGWSDPSNACRSTFQGFPKQQGPVQHSYEPSRTIHKDDCPNRAKRIAMIGNGVVPQQVKTAFGRLLKFA